MPMGPIELADQVGLDICLHVAEMLQRRPAARHARPAAMAQGQGREGRARQEDRQGPLRLEGRQGGESRTKKPSAAADMTDRLILPMLDVCVTCLREGVVADEEIVDGAMIFATGFAPFRGGPMHYARTRGVADVRDTLKRLAANIRPALPARSGLGLACNDPFGHGSATSSTMPERTRRRDHRAGRQEHRAGAAARARQGQSHRQRAVRQGGRPIRSIRLTIFTALTLEPPRAKSELERRFLRADSRSACSPAIPRSPTPRRCTPARCRRTSRSTSSSSRPAQWLGVALRAAELHFRELHPRAALRARSRRQRRRATGGAPRGRGGDAPYSLSCNPDLTLDLLALRARRAVSISCSPARSIPNCRSCPAMRRSAADEFDLLLDGPATDFPLFAPPREPVALADYAAGLHAASTRCRRRHAADRHRLARRRRGASADPAPRSNAEFRALAGVPRLRSGARCRLCHAEPFRVRPLRLQRNVRRGLARSVSAPASSSARSTASCCTPASSSARARSIERCAKCRAETAAKFRMTAISFVNELYGDEDSQAPRARQGALHQQRHDGDRCSATWSPTGWKTAASSAASAANTISSPRASRSEDARSVIMLRATRTAKGRARIEHPLALRPHHHPAPSARHHRDRIRHRRPSRQNRPRRDRRDAGDHRLALSGRTAAAGQGRRQDRARTFELPKSARDNTPDAIARAAQARRRCWAAAAVSIRHRFHRSRAAAHSGIGDVEVRVADAACRLADQRSLAPSRRPAVSRSSRAGESEGRERSALCRAGARRATEQHVILKEVSAFKNRACRGSKSRQALCSPCPCHHLGRTTPTISFTA